MALISAAVSAQELDSLKAIMDNKQSPDLNRREKHEVTNAPVAVEENDDTVKIRVMEKEIIKVVDGDDSTYIKVGDRRPIEVIDEPDSTRIRVGNKEINIVERDDDTDVYVNRIERNNSDSPNKFRGHWSGMEWGLNNFLDDANTLSREGDALFMDLNTDRSWSFSMNFAQYSLGFGTSHVGLLTGLGLEYNNYFFDRAITLNEDANDYIIPDTLTGGNLSKSKLVTSFLRIPLIFEVQLPGNMRSHRVYLSAGLVGGLKLGSHTKVLYKDDSGRKKDKNNDDFNISPFRYGMTARAGYGNLAVYADYYFSPFYIKDKGPSLHPFTVGMSFSF
jgi:hypothetical protein